MKKLCLCLTILAALLFFAGCGGSKKENKNDEPDTGETVTDEDAVDSDSSDSSDTVITDNDITDSADDSDTEPTETYPLCNPNPCENIANSDGTCTQTSPNYYVCNCDKHYDWNGEKCVEWCSVINCDEMHGSTGKCYYDDTQDDFPYFCECKEHYVLFDGYCTTEKKKGKCTGLPENATWNTASEITQEWSDEEEDFWPPLQGSYNEEPNGALCRFKCNEGYFWDEPNCKKAPDYTGLYWSERTEERMSADDAAAYCENLEEDGFTDWVLPTFDELRTLVQNCDVLMPQGECKVSEFCNSTASCAASSNCFCDQDPDPEEGYYSRLGDNEPLWSKTKNSNGSKNWSLVFNATQAKPAINVTNAKVRCVRHACEEGKVWDKNTKSCVTPETRTESCGSLPVEHSEWNIVSEIPQTWNSYAWNWEPPVNTKHNDTKSQTECRYKCIKDYNWTGEACTFDDFPECSETSKTPCYYKGFIWSKKAPQTKDNYLGSYYCNSLDEGLINDWDLPNIDTLRTLLKAERVAAECKVTEAPYCLSQENCWSCSTCTETGTPSSDDSYCSNWGTSYSDGRYSVFGDNGIFWSSSAYIGGKNWAVDFSLGRVYEDNSEVEHYLRCAIPYSTAIAQCISTGGTWNAGYNYCQTLEYKCGKMGGNWDSSTETCSRTAICTDKPTNSSWNTESSITQTYNGEDWLPSNTSTHSEIASSSECYFKCDYGYFWTGSECAVSPCNSNSCSALEGFSYTSCKPTSTTEYLCGGKDASTGYIWSAKAPDFYTWDEAVSYCDNLVEDYSDNWRLPTISELRTLVLNCVGSVPGGECGVVDTGNPSTSCLASSCETSGGYCGGCPSTIEHSKFGDTSEFWSSSTVTDASTSVWLLHFTYATIYSKGAPNRNQVRCIRN